MWVKSLAIGVAVLSALVGARYWMYCAGVDSLGPASGTVVASDPRLAERPQRGDPRSSDLGADIALMWETAVVDRDRGPVSTARAINAAARVFNTVELVGLTGAEAQALLGSPIHSSPSVYRGSPFWPLDAHGMIYRFDNGYWGWQIDVHCDGDDQPVTRVVKRWIH